MLKIKKLLQFGGCSDYSCSGVFEVIDELFAVVDDADGQAIDFRKWPKVLNAAGQTFCTYLHVQCHDGGTGFETKEEAIKAMNALEQHLNE